MITKSGKILNVLQPEINTIDIKDIAYALSNLCRFGGSCKMFYSVAQHSVYVANLLKLWGYDIKMQLAGLLHDAAEGYVTDLPTPIKRLLPDYKALENVVQTAIFAKFNIAYEGANYYHLIKEADEHVNFAECTQVMHKNILKVVKVALRDYRKIIIKPVEPKMARAMFIKKFNALNKLLYV
jgi:5'-deoxynucleotidase YfbR-like HD superfamily hydrolase